MCVHKPVGPVGSPVGPVGSVGSVGSVGTSLIVPLDISNINQTSTSLTVPLSKPRSRIGSSSSSSTECSSDSSSSYASSMDSLSPDMEDLFVSKMCVVDNPTNPDSATIKVPRARLEELEKLNDNLASIIKDAIKNSK